MPPERIIPGLFAVGECAAASFHGFNRLGTNSILELITMGKFAGERVLEHIREAAPESPETEGDLTFGRLDRYLKARGRDNVGQIREAMRALMTANVGVFRTEAGLTEAIDALQELKARAEACALSGRSLAMNQELLQRWELDNLLAVAMVIAQAARERRESRGAHFREDYPERLDAFNHHTLISMPEFGTVSLAQRPVDMSLYASGGAHREKFGWIARQY